MMPEVGGGGAGAASFPFKRWVRRTARRTMVWGLGTVALLALAAWWLRDPRGQAWDRAFGVLAAYGLLFLVSLAKIWWTAGKPAVTLGPDALAYRSLLGFSPRRVPYRSLLYCGPKAGTESLRLVVERAGVARELFLNLALIDHRHRFFDQLGQSLEAAGLARLPGRPRTWARPGWQEPLPDFAPEA